MLTVPQFPAENAGGGGNGADPELLDRLNETRSRIAAAAMRCGRRPESVRLLAVSKSQPLARIRSLMAYGQRDFGENYLQEALAKIQELSGNDICWHFIGQLQSNKTRAVAENFQWVHTVDRERIAARLSEQRPHYAPPLIICLQVRLADEPGKGGATPEELPALARRVSELPRLRLRGLMCIPPPRESFEDQYAFFARLAELQQGLLASGFELDALSMGMSTDLEAAVAAGATWVRIGTAIFGERTPQP